jgi:hypothetical protein
VSVKAPTFAEKVRRVALGRVDLARLRFFAFGRR